MADGKRSGPKSPKAGPNCAPAAPVVRVLFWAVEPIHMFVNC